MHKYDNRYMATCAPGMEMVIEAEIRGCINAPNNLRCSRGKAVFDCATRGLDYSAMRCIDNLFRLLCTFKIGAHKSDLKELSRNIAHIGFDLGNARGQRVVVSASRSGKHAYSRFDVAEAAANSLTSTSGFVAGNAENHDIAVRIDVVGNDCTVYKQLTTPQFRFRGNELLSAPGGIRPSVAHCLIKLSKPQSNDVFYDPFCGAGTIPLERACYKCKKIYASDIDVGAVDTARMNLKGSAVVFKADAAKTTMKDKSVNTVVTNIPWGRQIKISDMGALYCGFIKELGRILMDGGKAVILTDQNKLIHEACGINGMRVEQVGKMGLHGLNPSVYCVSRL